MLKYSWIVLCVLTVFLYAFPQKSIYVKNAAVNGVGTSASPFNNVQDAILAAMPGDVVIIEGGVYSDQIQSVRSGTANLPIIIRAADLNNKPIFKAANQRLKITHSYIKIDGLILDADFAAVDIVRMENAHYSEIKNSEIRNATKDGIDLETSDHVLIENTKIHHCLGGSLSNQVDAHGIVAVAQKYLTIRNCDIYYVSGDCFQTDPGRDTPRWDHVLIENSRLWTGPLPENAAAWNAGEVPGENAIDTKVDGDNSSYRAHLTLKNIEAFGFQPGYISNRAAFNIKEKVECYMENIKVYDNEIAFRLRGPGSRGGAMITMVNVVGYNNQYLFRTEDDLEKLVILNSTFDKPANGQYFRNVSGGYEESGFTLQNSLFMTEKPNDASHSSNMVANSSFFVDANNRNYRLSQNSPAINVGIDQALVQYDFDGNMRPAGQFDVGAFEFGFATGIDDEDQSLNDFELLPNYPNPFNPTTTISFNTSVASKITMAIYNILGQKIRTLYNDFLSPGSHQLTWNGKNDVGESVPSGVYFYQISNSKEKQVRQMHLLQ